MHTIKWARVRNTFNVCQWVCVHGVYHEDYPSGCTNNSECDGCCKHPEYPGRKVI